MGNEKFPQPTQETIRPGSELYDRSEIEAVAWELIESRQNFEQPVVKPQERLDNARTAIFEALTASGHYSKVEINGSLEEINQQVIGRLLNGFDPNLHPHELDRRFEELCNAIFIGWVEADVVEGLLPDSTVVHEESTYAQAMPEKVANSLGYRSQNHKGFSRSTSLRKNADGTYTRVIEAVSRTDSSPELSLSLLGVAAPQDENIEPDLLALKSVMLYDSRDYNDTVVDIQRRLDQTLGAGFRYGETINSEQIAYEDLKQESQRREEQAEAFSHKLAEYDLKLEMSLKAGQITYEEYRGQYAEQVLEILRAICVYAPEYAVDCFGEQAAVNYQRAAMLEAAGQHAQAMAELEKAKLVEKPVIICGMSLSAEKAKELGLETESADKLIEEGKEVWRWKRGVCRVPKCSSPRPTEVGPCSVCRNCQKVFDNGKDPAKVWKAAKPMVSKTVNKPSKVAPKLEAATQN